MRFAATAVMGIAAGVVLTTPGEAQDTRLARVDRIVAIVGRTVIPASRIEEELNVFRQQGGEFPADSAGRMALRRRILKEIIEDELLVQEAQRDTMVQVTEQEIQAEVEPAIRQVRSQFASELEFERKLRESGFDSPDDYRRWITEQRRRQILRDRFMAVLGQRGDIKPLPPTENELRAFYDDIKDQQPDRPPTVSFRQIVVPSQASPEAMREALLLADSLAKELQKGANFGVVARRFSDDPGSREMGGEMGWVRRGQGLVREFEQAAFRLQPGKVSPPVQTSFGFHLIEVVRAQPAEVQVRHILIAPDITDDDRARAKATAEQVAEALRNGASADSLARMHHDPIEDRVVDNVPQDQLPGTYGTALAGAQPGAIVGPVNLDTGNGRIKYAVIEFVGSRPGGRYTYEDLRDQLRRAMSERNALERFIKNLRDRTYIEERL